MATFVLMALASACAQLQPARGDRNGVAEPQLTERGLYRLPTDETWCGEYCDLGRHYVDIDATDIRVAELDLRATADPAAPVIDQLEKGEVVNATRSELLTPNRGVVRQAGDGYEVGDVVFRILGVSDWDYWLWRRGELRMFAFDRCEEDCSDEPPSEGLWVEYDTLGDGERWLYVDREGDRPSGWLLFANFPSVERANDNGR